MNISRVGVDLAKNVFQLHGVDRNGQVVLRRCLTRKNWIRVLLQATDKNCVIGMEACGGSNHWARLLMKEGYQVRLIAPQFVKPYVKSNKNDANDAEAICEAMSRPSMRFVTVKTVEQQDIQALHRVLQEFKSHRTAKANQIRGLVSEYGIVTRETMSSLRKAIPVWLEEANNGLTHYFRCLLQGLWEDLKSQDKRIKALNNQIEIIARTHPIAKRLQQLRGVGPLIATAFIATIGDGKQFSKGRQAAASLGLTPRQHSSGGKNRLFGITKRGDSYLRSLLVHGARAVVSQAKKKDDKFSGWMTALVERRHTNVAAVALANKTVRMAWAMITKEQDYDPNFAIN